MKSTSSPDAHVLSMTENDSDENAKKKQTGKCYLSLSHASITSFLENKGSELSHYQAFTRVSLSVDETNWDILMVVFEGTPFLWRWCFEANTCYINAKVIQLDSKVTFSSWHDNFPKEHFLMITALELSDVTRRK